MILIDHQVGTTTWASTNPTVALLRRNVRPAKFAKGTGAADGADVESGNEHQRPGHLMPNYEILPEAFRHPQSSICEGWSTRGTMRDFADACRHSGQEKFCDGWRHDRRVHGRARD